MWNVYSWVANEREAKDYVSGVYMFYVKKQGWETSGMRGALRAAVHKYGPLQGADVERGGGNRSDWLCEEERRRRRWKRGNSKSHVLRSGMAGHSAGQAQKRWESDGPRSAWQWPRLISMKTG